MNHPNTEEWMAYLYDEVALERKREMHAHLAQCVECSAQANRWGADLAALDEWELPSIRRVPRRWQPVTVLKWATAAAAVLAVGFVMGRQNSSAANEVAALKASVAQLTRKVESEETLRLLSAYARANELGRAEDRQTVALALREMDSRLLKLRTELETVAVNTETGFRQTKEGLTTLASYTVADRGDASDLPKTENKNQ